MSLIIFKQISQTEAFIISDTKFSYYNNIIPLRRIRAQSFVGGLKTIILSSNICISFSGEIFFAEQAINNFYSHIGNRIMDISLIAHYFFDFAKSSKGKTDFLLVASNTNNTLVPLYIDQNEIVPINSFKWIGDCDGFRVLQGHLNQVLGPIYENNHAELTLDATSPERGSCSSDFSEACCKYRQAMWQTCKSSNCPSVDGIATMVTYVNGSFAYIESSQISGIATANGVELNKGGQGPIHFGDASSGAYSVHHGREVSMPVYPAWFAHGNFGVIYSPTKSFTPQIIHCNSQKEFNIYVQEEFDIIRNAMDNLAKKLPHCD